MPILLASAVALTACEGDDDSPNPAPNNDPELITDLVLTFTDPDAQTSFEVRYSDPDGPGGNAPTQDAITLSNLTLYQVSVKVEDRSNPNVIDDVTVAVQAEGTEHQFFYVQNVEGLGITYSPDNVDSNGNPIGIKTIWTITQPTTSTQTLRVVLRHELNKSAEGAAQGVLSEDVGGDTDIDVTFDLTINP